MKLRLKTVICLTGALLASCNMTPPAEPPAAENPAPQAEETRIEEPVADAAGEDARAEEIYLVRAGAPDSLAKLAPEAGGLLLPFLDADGGKYGLCDTDGYVAMLPSIDEISRVFYGAGPDDWLYLIQEEAPGTPRFALTAPGGGVLFESYGAVEIADIYSDGGECCAALYMDGLYSILRVPGPDGRGVMETGFIYEHVSRFSDGLAAVRGAGETAYKYIDADGEVALFGPFECAGTFSEGMAVVCGDGLWGVVGRDGNWVTPPVYDGAQNFGGSVFAASMNGMWGLIGRDGSVVLPFDYTSVTKADADIYLLTRDGVSASAPTVSFYYDALTGRMVDHDAKYLGDGAWIRVYGDRVELLLEREGVTEAIFGAAGVKWLGQGLLELDSPRGLYRIGYGYLPGSDGVTLVKVWPQDGVLVVSENGKQGLLGMDGELLLPCEYDSIRPLGGGFLGVSADGYSGVMDASGRWLLRIS
ncbi:MAG: WG repeat-containing protein [Oscillospiraceae bacterium]|nr:WG repeat-containing protein [Oscillospiraceae bacterium]